MVDADPSLLKLTELTRAYPSSPIPAVSAVVLNGDAVLLVLRGHAPLAGEWSLPGGVVELGESLEHAVTRELQEETGLTVEPTAVLDAVDKIDRDARGSVQCHYVLVVFHCRYAGGTLQAGSDAEKAQWVPVHEISLTNKFTLSEDSLRVIELAFQRLKSCSRESGLERQD
ncbi:MAG TPA: NUDIX hydrolase [Acidobacteriaceae bacterium]|nr:NUDIX hydrolase [Acidobacteriaceae bacterium]